MKAATRVGWGAGIVALAVYLLFTWSQWRRFESPSWDLGIFVQVVQGYAQLSAPIVDIKGPGFNILGDHFSPILMLLAVPYAIAPSGLTLLIAQDVLFAISVFVVARAAVQSLGIRLGMVLAGLYLYSYGLTQAVAVQFHEIAFAVPLLALSLVAAHRRRWRAAACWAAPLVWVKEDLGLTVCALGLVLLWPELRFRIASWSGAHGGARGSEQQLGVTARERAGWPWGVALVGWGAAWFLLVTKTVIPSFNASGNWDYRGQLPLGELISHPLTTAIQLVNEPTKVGTLLVIAVLGGLVAWRSPLMLVALPTLAWRMLSTTEAYWSRDWHYDAVLMPIVFVAMIDGLVWVQRVHETALARRVSVAAESERHELWPNSIPRMVLVAPLISVLVTGVVAPSTRSAQVTQPVFWQPSTREPAARQVLAAIPVGASVESDFSLLGRLAPDRRVYFAGTSGNPAAQYVLLDRYADDQAATGAAARWARQAHPGARYTQVLNTAGYSLAKRQ